MTERVCEWCGVPLGADIPETKVTCCDAHRAKRWRWLNGYGSRAHPAEAPPAGSPLLRGRSARTNGGHGRLNGLQVSYRKALRVLTERLGPYVEGSVVEEALREALPEKQRKRLEAR